MSKMVVKRFFCILFLLIPILLLGQENMVIRQFNPVYFGQNSDTIERNYFAMLDSMGEYLQSDPTFELRLASYGHPTESNFNELIWKRASNISDYLKKNFKIKVAEILETNTNNRGTIPRSDESYPESERATLRKVEFDIVKTQWKYEYTISGQVYDKETKLFLEDCKIKVFATTNFTMEMLSDSMGRFHVEDIPIQASTLLFEVERSGFYEEKFKMKWGSIPHDTVIDIQLSPIPVSIHWLPEVYFGVNSLSPDSEFQKKISQVADVIQSISSDPDFSLSIIGYKDSLETKDLRLERANLVYDALVEKGIDKTRLKVEISNEPYAIKPDEVYRTVEGSVLASPAIVADSPNECLVRRINRSVVFRINR